MCHDISESSALEELHDHPELVLDQVAVVHLNDVRMMVVSHYHHLNGNQLIVTNSSEFNLIRKKL